MFSTTFLSSLFIGFPACSERFPSFTLVFLHCPHVFLVFPWFSLLSHWSFFMFMLLIDFLELNLAVAVAPAIAVVALLVLVVAAAIAVVDLWHDGIENRKRGGGWGKGAAPPPKALGGSRCSALLYPFVLLLLLT